MSKKKSASKPTPLSPENYIRKISRNLPVIECLINSNWKESKMATIFIVRQHVNKNVTFCTYLVDLNCLGVKDTGYKFNTSYADIERIKEDSKYQALNFITTTYNLVHNIIYAAIEFAEEFGFKPCKDFTSITAYFLEEDTDDIPVIEIECGEKSGKPMYVNTGFDSPAREKQILTQLAKTAGEGNYHFMLGGNGKEWFEDQNDFEDDEEDEDDEDDDFEEDDEDDDEDDDFEEDENAKKITAELKALSEDEQKSLYRDLFLTKNKNADITLRLCALCAILVNDVVDGDEIEDHLIEFERTFDMDFIEFDELPNSLFKDVAIKNKNQLLELFVDTFDRIIENREPEKALAVFRKKMGDIRSADFMELCYYQKNKKHEEYKNKLKECYLKYPDYLLFQVHYYFLFHEQEETFELKHFEGLLINTKQAVTKFEANLFFYFYTFLFVDDENTTLPLLLAYLELTDSFDFLDEHTEQSIRVAIQVAMMRLLYTHLESDSV